MRLFQEQNALLLYPPEYRKEPRRDRGEDIEQENLKGSQRPAMQAPRGAYIAGLL